MRFIILNTGSNENGYILQADTGEVLVIEAGCHISKLEQALNWDFDGVVGCIVTHFHGDHFQHAQEYVDRGIDVYANEHALTAGEVLDSPGYHLLESGKQIKLGNFTIKPLEVAHDIPCLAFMIDHPECGRTFFLTDSSYCRWNLSKAKIQNWLVECNYIPEKLKANYESGRIPKNVYDRVLNGHFSIDNCIDFFAANDLSHTVRIITLHKSAGNGDGKIFKQRLESATGKEVIIGKAGLVVEPFNSELF